MNHTTRSVGVTAAITLLAVAAAGTAAFGVFAPVIALSAADLLGGTPGAVARAAVVVIGLISLLFAASAAVAARMLRAGRTAGVVTGLVLGVILVAGPAVAAASGGWHPALFASVALGAGIIGSLAVALPAEARS
jgi:hypothetical protein